MYLTKPNITMFQHFYLDSKDWLPFVFSFILSHRLP